MGFFSALAIGSAVVGALGANRSRKQRNNAAKDRERINEIRNFQARRQYIQQFRRAQANALSSAVASGLGGAGVESSRVQGVQSSLRTQTSLGIFENLLMERLGKQANKLERDAARTDTITSVVQSAIQTGAALYTGGTAPTGATAAQGSTTGLGPLKVPEPGSTAGLMSGIERSSRVDTSEFTRRFYGD